jgi:hypothetical protein
MNGYFAVKASSTFCVVSALVWFPHQLKVSVTGAVLIGSGAEPLPPPLHAAAKMDETGQTVRHTGFGLGGWMNMENFISGYPGSEQNIRRLMLEAMGQEAYQAFFDEFMDGFFGERDARLLAAIGLNSVRIAVNYRHLEDEAGFARLDRAISTLARHGLYKIIDLHALPGGQNEHWHSDNPTHVAQFWEHRPLQDSVVQL